MTLSHEATVNLCFQHRTLGREGNSMAHFWLGSRNLDQIYGKLLQRQKDGKLGQRNVAQDASVSRV